MDEKDGPYKVVAHLVGAKDPYRYSIVRQRRNQPFFQEVIPDAGTGETARVVTNLLNKQHKETTDEEADGVAEATGEGVPSSDQ